MKKLLRRVHLLIALLSAFFLLSLSLSGALLLYAKDIERVLFPQQWTIKATDKRVNVEQLIKLVQAQHPANVSLITLPKHPLAPWQFRMDNGDYLNVNPYSNTIIHQYQYYQTFYGFLMSWHRWLAFDNKNKPLKVFMSVASLLLIGQLLLGIYLWCKPKKPFKRLSVKWRAKAKIKYAQLHNLIGVCTFIPLILIAISGMTFHWKDQVMASLEWLFNDNIQASIRPTTNNDNANNLAINQALINGQQQFPNAELYRIYLPHKSNTPISLRYSLPQEAHGNSWVWHEPDSGQVVGYYDATAKNVVTQVWNFRYPFHVGEFIGWPVKLLWMILSLTPLFFIISGLYLYWTRRATKVNGSTVKHDNQTVHQQSATN